MTEYALGLVSVSFRNHTPREILREMKKTDLTLIEWGSDIHAICHDSKALKEIALLQKEYGISCSSYGTYFRLGVSEINELSAYIQAAKMLGTDILRLWCGDKKSSEYTADERQKLFSQCNAAASVAEKHNVTLCMECHNNTYTQTLDGAFELMHGVNSPNFRMYWQPNQFVTVKGNMEYARQISPYVKRIHVFNWEGSNMYPLRSGIDVWREYLSCFDTDTPLLLEFMPDGKLESLSCEAEALCDIVKGI